VASACRSIPCGGARAQPGRARRPRISMVSLIRFCPAGAALSAIAMLREMGTPRWLAQAEAELATLM